MDDLRKIEKKCTVLLNTELVDLRRDTIEQWFKDCILFFEEELRLRESIEDYEHMMDVDVKIKSLKDARLRYYNQLANKQL